MKRKPRYSAALLALAMVLTAAIAPRPARQARPAAPVEQRQSKPLEGKTIFVDAGHGGTDGGARAKDSGTWEKEINLQVARLVKERLMEKGAQVLMSREGDMQYSHNKRADLTARLDMAQAGGADLVVSIHMNEYRTRAESGPQVFYRAGQEQSRLLAGALQEALIRHLSPRKERQAMAGDYFILSLDCPSVLVECGFLSNAAEERLLLDPAYRQRVAQGIGSGIEAYFLLAQSINSGV